MVVIARPNREYPPEPDALALAALVVESLDELTPDAIDSAAQRASKPWAGNSLDKAREIFDAEVKRRPRIPLSARASRCCSASPDLQARGDEPPRGFFAQQQVIDGSPASRGQRLRP